MYWVNCAAERNPWLWFCLFMIRKGDFHNVKGVSVHASKYRESWQGF